MTTSEKVKAGRKRVGHAEVFDPECPVCTHDAREDAERLYLAHTKMTRLEELFEISKTKLQDHMKALGLMKQRADDLESLIQHAVESGFERDVFDKMDGDQIIKLVDLRAKMLGKIKQASGDARPPMVVFIGVPEPGHVITEKKVEVLEGHLVPLEGQLALSVTVKEAASEEGQDEDQGQDDQP